MGKNDLAQALPGHLLVETMDEKDPRPKYTTQAGQAGSWRRAWLEVEQSVAVTSGPVSEPVQRAERLSPPPCPFTPRLCCRAPRRLTAHQSHSPDDKNEAPRGCEGRTRSQSM